MKNKRFRVIIAVFVFLFLTLFLVSFKLSKNYLQSGNKKLNIFTDAKPSPTPVYQKAEDLLKDREASISAKQVEIFVEAVKKFAKEATVLELDNCQPTPLVFQVDKGKEFEIRNKGDKDIKLVLSIGKEYQIPANQSITAKGILDAAIYYYQCGISGEKPKPPVGIIYIKGPVYP